jgi:hypothetical protein
MHAARQVTANQPPFKTYFKVTRRSRWFASRRFSGVLRTVGVGPPVEHVRRYAAVIDVDASRVEDSDDEDEESWDDYDEEDLSDDTENVYGPPVSELRWLKVNANSSPFPCTPRLGEDFTPLLPHHCLCWSSLLSQQQLRPCCMHLLPGAAGGWPPLLLPLLHNKSQYSWRLCAAGAGPGWVLPGRASRGEGHAGQCRCATVGWRRWWCGWSCGLDDAYGVVAERDGARGVSAALPVLA